MERVEEALPRRAFPRGRRVARPISPQNWGAGGAAPRPKRRRRIPDQPIAPSTRHPSLFRGGAGERSAPHSTFDFRLSTENWRNPMALTLTEAGKLTQDLLLRGVIETIVSESAGAALSAVHGDHRQRADLQPGGDAADGDLLRGRGYLDGGYADVHAEDWRSWRSWAATPMSTISCSRPTPTRTTWRRRSWRRRRRRSGGSGATPSSTATSAATRSRSMGCTS